MILSGHVFFNRLFNPGILPGTTPKNLTPGIVFYIM